MSFDILYIYIYFLGGDFLFFFEGGGGGGEGGTKMANQFSFWIPFNNHSTT